MKIYNEKEHLCIQIGKICLRLGYYRLFHKKEYAIVLLEAGGFGDYITTRPYFKYLKRCYPDCKLVYVSQEWMSSFSKIYDKSIIDDVISFDLKQFKSNKTYRKSLLNTINNKYNTVKYIHLNLFHLGHSRQLSWRMYFAKKIKAKEKYTGICRDRDCKERQLKTFNRKIELDTYQFRSEVYKQYFEKILNTKIVSENGYIESPDIFPKDKNNIAICMCASTNWKTYPVDKWIKVLNELKKLVDCDTKILFFGNNSEYQIVEKAIKNMENNSNCINLAGEIDISSLPIILKSCKLMISMESGNTHLAHYLKLPVICLASGEYYGSALPYPDNSVDYVFPDKFNQILEVSDYKDMVELFYFANKNQTVKDIKPSQVVEKIKEKLFTLNKIH